MFSYKVYRNLADTSRDLDDIMVVEEDIFETLSGAMERGYGYINKKFFKKIQR